VGFLISDRGNEIRPKKKPTPNPENMEKRRERKEVSICREKSKIGINRRDRRKRDHPKGIGL